MKSLWNDNEAANFAGDLGLRVYTSRLLGREPSLVLHGGGNTSVKIKEKNILGQEEALLYVKGSGWDLEKDCDADFLEYTNGVSVTLDFGDHVTCVFTNTKWITLTVIKDAYPAEDDIFDFTGDPAEIAAAVRAGAVEAAGTIHEEPDRRLAIRAALTEAGQDDVVLILGKGHEQGQERAGTVAPFDDREVATEELARLGGDGA